MKSRFGIVGFRLWTLVACAAFPARLGAESLRVAITDAVTVSHENPSGTSVSLSQGGAVLISLDGEVRFLRGVELEFTVPQTFLPHRGSLALVVYGDLNHVPAPGVADIEARQYSFDPVPNKIQSVYQIPLRPRHGLRGSPYAQVQAAVLPPASFPVLFHVMPIIKGLSEDLAAMHFTLTVRPILSDEGIVRVVPRFPENLPGRPFTVLIDGEVMERPLERLLREGEHHLAIISGDYRNESRVFLVERGKILSLTITLQDPTPLVIFEGPENARVFFDGEAVTSAGPFPVEAGLHEVRFVLSDYTITRNITVQRGKTYRLALAVDLLVEESD
ncbi:MAG: hypothetical protein LBC88_08690 [Spirochaetaceae bacterium]|jgi:hypothetical protein|nr:hypothetical protein [Spirochaetaceae bacterium]